MLIAGLIQLGALCLASGCSNVERDPVLAPSLDAEWHAPPLAAEHRTWTSAAQRSSAAGASAPLRFPPAPTGSPAAALVLGVETWVASPTESLGMLAGTNAGYAQRGLNVFGTDLGFTYTHDDRIYTLFGDTWSDPAFACPLNPPKNDDSIATLPLKYDGGVPAIEFVTRSEAPDEYRAIQLFRGVESVQLDAFKVPVAGFSDGERAYAMFQAQTALRCTEDSQSCSGHTGAVCMTGLPQCRPAPVTVPTACEDIALLCLSGQCPDDVPVCVETRSSQFDGTARGAAASVMSLVDIGRARANEPATFDSIASWPTNAFSHPTVRTIARWTGKLSGSDYGPGTESLLIWGRPGMIAEEGREARVYFATQPLPLEGPDAANFAPQYFAGLAPATDEPRWSSDPAHAEPLALDGKPGGDPAEAVRFVGTMSVTWLGAPIERWLMLYGGDASDGLLADPVGTRATAHPGSIVMRFAEHPWGPWSSAQPLLSPGDPNRAGDAYGPGGILFHPDCVDTLESECARSDPYGPSSTSLLSSCLPYARRELGRLYAPYVIDPYTRANARGGLDIIWFVSSWNPYAVHVMRTSLEPN